MGLALPKRTVTGASGRGWGEPLAPNVSILNLEPSRPSDSPGGETSAAEEVASVREMLESGEPPGLDRIRRFVVKPRPRLWKFGVGVWLWVKRIGEWLLRFLKWIGKGTHRVARAAHVAAFLGRRAQNLGARIGAVGRNWSSAEGRLGALGDRLARFGVHLVKGGAGFAQVGDGVTDLTKRADRFLAGEPASGSEPPIPGKDTPAETPPPSLTRRRRRKKATVAGGSERSAAPSVPPSTGDGDQPAAVVADPVPAADPPPPAPPEPVPAPAPSPLPDDLPFYLRNQIEQLGQRPRRETVEHLILASTEERGWMEPAELAAWLGMSVPHLSRSYLGPMTEAGKLVRLYPNRPTHPEQAYRSTHTGEPRR